MGKLDHLKIKRVPAAFAGFAKNFNQQVDLLASIQGGPGIDVQVAHSPRKIVAPPKGQPRPKEQPRGKILFTLRPSAINGIGVSGGAGNSNTVNVNIVTSGSTIATISVPSAAVGFDYPTAWTTCSNSAFASMTSGFTAAKANSARVAQLTADDDAGIYQSDGTNIFSINYSALLHNIGIRQRVGCNSGTPANYLVVASDFF